MAVELVQLLRDFADWPDALAYIDRLPEAIRGHCQLARSRGVFDRAAVLREHSRRHLHARLLPPHPEGLVAGATVLSGGHQVPPRTEVAVDHGVR